VLLHHYLQGEHKSSEWLENLENIQHMEMDLTPLGGQVQCVLCLWYRKFIVCCVCGTASLLYAVFVVLQVYCMLCLWYRKFSVCSVCGTTSLLYAVFVVPQVYCMLCLWYRKFIVCSVCGTASLLYAAFVVPQVYSIQCKHNHNP
jgi:hypothetical protein